MQEIKKRRIVIASVLKPVNDTRMFEKIGVSLSRVADVHIIGFPGGNADKRDGVTFHATRFFKRLSLTRLTIPWRIFFIIRKQRPDVLIITTHELLLQAVLGKIFWRVPFYYDVQENYFRNILYTDAFPKIVRPLLAAFVRLKEIVLSPFVHTFLLAEKGYVGEMRFVQKKYVVLENKFNRLSMPPRPQESKQDNKIHLIFSGTLSPDTGVFKAIELAALLHSRDDSIHLTIIGYCSQRETYKRLRAEINSKPFVTVIGGDSLVPHSAIIERIRSSNFGIVAYPRSPATENAIPTKTFEYLACGLPILTVNHKLWVDYISQFGSCIPFDSDHPDPAAILTAMHEVKVGHIPGKGIFWEEEEEKLLDLFNYSKKR